MKYRFFLLILFLAFILSFTSCSSSDSDYAFKYAISGNPKTLDPQCALSDSSDSVISSIFQGLFYSGDNGEINEGMIEDYSVSEDGLKWTFYLKSGIYWSDGEEFSAECTADDYVFAFQRLFRPSTKSERASEYYIIKNSKEINCGTIIDMTLLGVKAIDKYTLEITLNEPCSDFRALLSLSPAMPCNKLFFESTQGRYGLAADCIASNSGYYVHTWNYDKWSDEGNYIILRRNKLNAYSENTPYTINLFIDPLDERKDFEEEILKVYKGKNHEEIIDFKKIYSFSEYETAVWGLIFNLNEDFGNQNYRLELAAASFFRVTDERYTVFHSIIPDIVDISDSQYRDSVGELSMVSGIDSNIGALSGMRMIMPVGTGLRAEVGKMLQNWQSDCGFYCSVSELESEEYYKKLKNGEFDIAMIRLSGEYNSPYAYLNDFMPYNSANYSGYNSRKYNHIINSAFTSVDSSLAAVYYKEAEQLLIDSGVFVPLCTETEYVFFDEKIDAILYNPFSGVYSVR